MYIPGIFRSENPEAIKSFIHENAFAAMVSLSEGKLWATHLPLFLDSDESGNHVLHGHISIENPQWKDIENQEVLVIFSGAHAYISSSWYQQENVPTWNYSAVHVNAIAKVMDQKQTVEHLKKLVDKYEAGRPNAIAVENLSQKTMLQARAIVGIELRITKIDAKRKLSQNRNADDFSEIIRQLESTGNPSDAAVAKEMRIQADRQANS